MSGRHLDTITNTFFVIKTLSGHFLENIGLVRRVCMVQMVKNGYFRSVSHPPFSRTITGRTMVFAHHRGLSEYSLHTKVYFLIMKNSGYLSFLRDLMTQKSQK